MNSPIKTLSDWGYVFRYRTKYHSKHKELINVNIKDTAQSYEPKETKNIADLQSVDVDSDIITKDYTRDDGTGFSVNVIVIDDEDYRVPTSVIKQLKEHISANKDLKFFKVNKAGTGLKTSYTVIPLK